MRVILLLILTTVFASSYGQHFIYPSIQLNGSQVTDFVPAGWVLLDSASGDLNKDGLSDVAVVLQHKDSIVLVKDVEDTVLTQPRILVILFRNRLGKGFDVAEQSNSFILNHDNAAMEDPFDEMRISNGVLQIKFQLFYSAGSWYITNAAYKFRFEGGQFVLIGADKSSFHRASMDFEEYSYNFLTGKRSLTKGNEEKGTKKTSWKAVRASPVKTLRTFSAPFTWEVERNVYL